MKSHLKTDLHGVKIHILGINNKNHFLAKNINTIELQEAVIIYLLKLTACRPGSKKNDKTDDEPSGFGIANMRVNDITLLGDNTVRLQFITKGGTEYDGTHEVSKRVYALLEKYYNGDETLEKVFNVNESKRVKRPLFNQIKYSEFAAEMKRKYEVYPKDFRTYVASTRFQEELNSFSYRNPDADEQTKLEESKNFYKNAWDIVQRLLLNDFVDPYIDPRITVAW